MRLHHGLIAAIALALGGCATTDLGVPVPGTYPSGGTTYPQQQGQMVSGQVTDVDHNNGRFMFTSDNGQRVELRYDQNTRAFYNGQQVNPSGLERGDRIRAEVLQTQGVWYVRQIEVTQDVRGTQGSNPPYGSGYGTGYADLTGAVTYVDTRNQTIQFTRGGYSGAAQQVRYDNYTVVEYQGRQYRPENLQRGDSVRITLRNTPAGSVQVADRVIVEVAASTR